MYDSLVSYKNNFVLLYTFTKYIQLRHIFMSNNLKAILVFIIFTKLSRT